MTILGLYCASPREIKYKFTQSDAAEKRSLIHFTTRVCHTAKLHRQYLIFVSSFSFFISILTGCRPRDANVALFFLFLSRSVCVSAFCISVMFVFHSHSLFLSLLYVFHFKVFDDGIKKMRKEEEVRLIKRQ